MRPRRSFCTLVCLIFIFGNTAWTDAQEISMMSSEWSRWSPWSFCSSSVRIRVRACSTVRGFKCVGHNKEFQSCDESVSTTSSSLRKVSSDSDSSEDHEDPWTEERALALRQLYPDYEHPSLALTPRRETSKTPTPAPSPSTTSPLPTSTIRVSTKTFDFRNNNLLQKLREGESVSSMLHGEIHPEHASSTDGPTRMEESSQESEGEEDAEEKSTPPPPTPSPHRASIAALLQQQTLHSPSLTRPAEAAEGTDSDYFDDSEQEAEQPEIRQPTTINAIRNNGIVAAASKTLSEQDRLRLAAAEEREEELKRQQTEREKEKQIIAEETARVREQIRQEEEKLARIREEKRRRDEQRRLEEQRREEERRQREEEQAEKERVREEEERLERRRLQEEERKKLQEEERRRLHEERMRAKEHFSRLQSTSKRQEGGFEEEERREPDNERRGSDNERRGPDNQRSRADQQRNITKTLNNINAIVAKLEKEESKRAQTGERLSAMQAAYLKRSRELRQQLLLLQLKYSSVTPTTSTTTTPASNVEISDDTAKAFEWLMQNINSRLEADEETVQTLPPPKKAVPPTQIPLGSPLPLRPSTSPVPIGKAANPQIANVKFVDMTGEDAERVYPLPSYRLPSRSIRIFSRGHNHSEPRAEPSSSPVPLALPSARAPETNAGDSFEWSEWSEWSECVCGWQLRKRICLHPLLATSQESCPAPQYERMKCEGGPC